MTEVEFVGLTISEDGLHFIRDKIDKVLDVNFPVFGKQPERVLGVTVYFHDHIECFSTKVHIP